VTRSLDVAAAADVAPGTMLMTWVDGTEPVLVVNIEGVYHAVQGICSHEYFELDKGFLTDGSLTCALHLSRFDLTSGEALAGRSPRRRSTGPAERAAPAKGSSASLAADADADGDAGAQTKSGRPAKCLRRCFER